MNSLRRLIVTLFILCACATGALAQTKSADVGATEADYGWWRDARFGIFIHWGPGAFVHKNSLPCPITARRVRLVITETNGQLPTIVAFDLFDE